MTLCSHDPFRSSVAPLRECRNANPWLELRRLRRRRQSNDIQWATLLWLPGNRHSHTALAKQHPASKPQCAGHTFHEDQKTLARRQCHTAEANGYETTRSVPARRHLRRDRRYRDFRRSSWEGAGSAGKKWYSTGRKPLTVAGMPKVGDLSRQSPSSAICKTPSTMWGEMGPQTRFRTLPNSCGLRESSLGYTCQAILTAHSRTLAVACGESSLGYTFPSAPLRGPVCCGLRGIVARIHFLWRAWGTASAVAGACGESSLGYTRGVAVPHFSKLWLAGNRRSDTLIRLEGEGEEKLLWLAGNRRSDTLNCWAGSFTHSRCGLRGIVARIDLFSRQRENSRSCGLRGIVARIHSGKPAGERVFQLWLAGNRRSDTLRSVIGSSLIRCGLRGIVARIHSYGDEPGLHRLWLAGNRRSDTLKATGAPRPSRLWLAGNRRSDTLVVAKTGNMGCGLRGIVARIHSPCQHRLPTPCCGLRGIVARRHLANGAVLVRPLWLAGNRRSDTLRFRHRARSALWLAGDRRSDTLNSPIARLPPYGAVACGESSLGYTPKASTVSKGAVACGESSLG